MKGVHAMSILITLNDIVVSFDGEKILDHIDLDIHDKEFVTLLGPSGCGKTTTLRIIGGFITPDSGTVTFDGKKINQLPPYKRNVNTVFQRYALFPHLNVYENIAFGLRVKKLPEKEISKRVQEMLKLVGLVGFEKRSTARLSGGQQQRVAIARAVVSNPKLILADEPTGNLDSKNGKEVMDLLTELNKEGTTIVMVTHSQKDASCAQRIVNLFDGEIVSDVKNEL